VALEEQQAVRRSSELNFRFFLLSSDIVLTLVSLALARIARLAWPIGAEIVHPKAAELSPIIYVLVACLWLFLFNLLSVYSPRKMNTLMQELQAVATAIMISTATLAGVLYLSYRDVPRLVFIYFFLFDAIALLGFRILSRLVFQVRAGRVQDVRELLILGAGKVGMNLARAIRSDRGWPAASIIGFLDDDPQKIGTAPLGIPVLGGLDMVCELVKSHNVDEVIFALPLRAHRRVINLVLDLQKLPVEVKVVPDLFDLAFARTTVEDVDGLPLISLRAPAINGYTSLVKRVFDVVVASLLVVITSPVMAAIAVAIKLDSPGPAIFSQWRVGENGRLFRMYKFRTMVDGADKQIDTVIQKTEDGKHNHKHPNDPRITRLGQILRRSSLDELPQFINVIKGDMSLVGPRPELPFVVEQYEPWQRRRLSVPPGITGWWQISGRSERPMHLHTEDDLYYIKNYSLLLDLQILWKTVEVVIKGRGAF
jgi:exopolysaccharide biosynthesis polyprenyl glycosylphosphotransferase